MTSVLIGYLPKRITLRPDWLKAPQVAEICSVSDCIASPPCGWIDRWLHNDLFVYDAPELAWKVVPDLERAAHKLYGYRLFPVEFRGERQQPFDVPPLTVEPMSPEFELLGYDMVSRSLGTTFECSPLSCNHLAETIPTNQYCLVNDADTAFRLASMFEGQQPEPGPYFVVEVWRARVGHSGVDR